MKGLVVAGRYEVERELGRGGMGAVVAAHDRVTGARVAIKLGRAEDAARIAREAEIGARLTSPHAVRVAGRGDDPPFVVHEYLEGTTLERVIDEQGPIAPARAVAIGLQILDALAEIHQLGFVHRDVKPGTVFLVAGDHVNAKLLDVGLATPAGSPGDDAGTAAFKAPEQARGEPLDGRADLYALGATLFRAVTGRHVFEPAPIGAFFEALMNAPRPGAGVDPGLDAIIARALAASRDDRFASAKEFALDLARWSADQ